MSAGPISYRCPKCGSSNLKPVALNRSKLVILRKGACGDCSHEFRLPLRWPFALFACFMSVVLSSSGAFFLYGHFYRDVSFGRPIVHVLSILLGVMGIGVGVWSLWKCLGKK